MSRRAEKFPIAGKRNKGQRSGVYQTVLLMAALLMVPMLDPPRFTLPPGLLRPGGILTIYGTNLGPRICSVPIPQNGPYPLETCGVRVTAGGLPAGLMYVSENQIIELPEGLPDALTPIQVYFGALRSDPAMAQFSTHTAFLHPRAPAYVHMPIWIEVDLPYPYRAPYPCQPDPWNFQRHVPA
jgi:hypothetical protein